jgi:hypothetical protein
MGRKYVDTVDFSGQNPDNPFKRCAVFVRDEPSNENGDWVNIERLQKQYNISENNLEKSKEKPKRQTAFKLIQFNNERQEAKVLIGKKIYTFAISDYFWNTVKYLYFTKNLPMKALVTLKEKGKVVGEPQELTAKQLAEMAQISTNMPINSRFGNYMDPIKKDPVTKKDTRIPKEVNFINEEEQQNFEKWWDTMRPEQRQATLALSSDNQQNQQSKTPRDPKLSQTISTLKAKDFSTKYPNDFLSTFNWKKKNPQRDTMQKTNIQTIGTAMKEGQTGLKPDTSYEDGQKIKVSKLDIDMFRNIHRDSKALVDSVEKIVSDLAKNNGENYDDLVMNFKRMFEPLVVTVQKLPEDTSGLGKENEQPEDEPKDTNEPTPEEAPEETPDTTEQIGGQEDEPDQGKDLNKKKPKDGFEKEQQSQDNLDEAKRHKITPKSQKIAMTNKKGRVVWVSRKKANDYRKKGYNSATSIKPSALKKKNANPHKDLKRWQFKEAAPNGDSNIVMNNDQTEFMDELKNVRVVMVKEGRTFSVKGNKIAEMMQKGYAVFKEKGYPVIHSLYESEVKKIVDDEVEKTLNEYVEKVIKTMRKQNGQ